MSRRHREALNRMRKAMSDKSDLPGSGCPSGLPVSWSTIRLVVELAERQAIDDIEGAR